MDAEMFEARNVAIVWSESDRGLVTEVVVVNGELSPEIHGQYDNARGNVDGDWMEAGARANDPMAVFLDMMNLGFSDRASFDQAVAQFGKIRECSWARYLATPVEARPCRQPGLHGSKDCADEVRAMAIEAAATRSFGKQ